MKKERKKRHKRKVSGGSAGKREVSKKGKKEGSTEDGAEKKNGQISYRVINNTNTLIKRKKELCKENGKKRRAEKIYVRVKREGGCGTIRVVVSELKQESLEFQQKHK